MDRFIPGRRDPVEGPLKSYLQPIPASIVAAYIHELTYAGDVVLTPFAQSDSVGRTAAEAGRRAILAHGNPLCALIVRFMASPPPAEEIHRLMGRVAHTPHHGITVRQHLQDLYRSHCPACASPISVSYFVWQKEPRLLLARGYSCPHCGSAGEVPPSEDDIALAKSFPARGLSYWRALHRLAGRDDPTYARLQELLEIYTARNVYALFELTHHLTAIGDETPGDARLQDMWRYLLLFCLEEGAGIDSPDRSRRLTRPDMPARFLERNVWLAFERAGSAALRLAERPPLTIRTRMASPLESITVAAAGIAALARSLPEESVGLIITTPPPPEPAFWALSFLWTTWLYGKEDAALLEPWLRRHRIDWNWYAEVLSLALKHLARPLAPDGHIVFVLRSEQERWIEALLAAVGQAGIRLEGLALQPAADPSGASAAEYRLVLSRHPAQPLPIAGREEEDLARTIRAMGLQATTELLSARDEPTPGIYLHAAGHSALCTKLPWKALEGLPLSAPPFYFAQEQLWRDAVGAKGALPLAGDEEIREGLPTPGLHPLLWWWAKPPPDAGSLPLSDRVEAHIVTWIAEHGPAAGQDICEAVCAAFPGLLTPEEPLMEAILSSYCRQDEEGLWRLRPEDLPQNRGREIEELAHSLRALAAALKTDVSFRPEEGAGHLDLFWESSPPLHFHIAKDTAHRHLTLADPRPGMRRFLVLPGGRASLVLFRQRRCPLWSERFTAGGWSVVKYRLVRHIQAEGHPSLKTLLPALARDPLTEEDKPQIRLI